MIFRRLKKYLIIFAALFLCTAVSYAGNVQTFGIGAKATAMGEAVSAYADDVFATYYNPAGLTLLDKKVFTAGAMVFDSTCKISDFEIIKNGTKVSDIKEEFTSENDLLFKGTIGFAMPLNDTFYFGIASYSPYGFHIEWDKDPEKNPGAIYAWKSYYGRQVVSPTLGIKLSDSLSVGFGVSIGKSVSEASKTILFEASNPKSILNNSFLILETTDDTNVSYNAGLMYQPVEWLSMGLTYRGKTETEFEGDATLILVNGTVKKGTAEFVFDHPESVQGGIRYIGESVSVEFDLTWTNWASHKDQVEYVDFPSLPTFSKSFPHERNWEDTVQYKIGLEWSLTDSFALRTGFAYDPTPIVDETFDFGWPDTDRSTFNIGFGWNMTESFILDCVFQYVNSTPVREIEGGSEELNGVYSKAYGTGSEVFMKDEGTLYVVGLDLSYTF